MATKGSKGPRNQAIRKQQVQFKPPFDSPLTVRWPALSTEQNAQLLDRVAKDLQCCKRTKREKPPREPVQKRAKTEVAERKTGQGPAPAAPSGQAKQPKPADAASRKRTHSELNSSESAEQKAANAAARSELVVGVNDVARAVQDGKVRLVLVCKDVSPAVMVQHIPLLCYAKGVPLCAVSGLSSRLAPILGGRSVTAVAFKCAQEQTPSVFDALVEFVRSITPPLSVQWLAESAAKGEETEEAVMQRLQRMVHDMQLLPT